MLEHHPCRDAFPRDPVMSLYDILAKAVLSTSSDAIIAADKEGIIRFWNPGAERIFGYARNDAIGQSLDIIIPERLRKRHWDGYYHVIRSGESRYGHGDVLAVPGDQKGRRRGLHRVHDRAVARWSRRAHRVGSDHARRHKALRGNACTEARARGGDEVLALTAWPFVLAVRPGRSLGWVGYDFAKDGWRCPPAFARLDDRMPAGPGRWLGATESRARSLARGLTRSLRV